MATFIDAAERRPALQRTHATVAKPLKATLPRWSIVVGGAAVASQTRERMKSAALARRMVQVRVNRCGHAPCWIPSPAVRQGTLMGDQVQAAGAKASGVE